MTFLFIFYFLTSCSLMCPNKSCFLCHPNCQSLKAERHTDQTASPAQCLPRREEELQGWARGTHSVLIWHQECGKELLLRTHWDQWGSQVSGDDQSVGKSSCSEHSEISEVVRWVGNHFYSSGIKTQIVLVHFAPCMHRSLLPQWICWSVSVME